MKASALVGEAPEVNSLSGKRRDLGKGQFVDMAELGRDTLLGVSFRPQSDLGVPPQEKGGDCYLMSP